MPHAEAGRTACITIESDLKNVALVGLAVQGICALLPFDETMVYQIELCVVEAVTNVIKHAYQEQGGREVGVEIQVGADHLAIAITDQGRPGLCLDAAWPDFDPADRATAPEGGFGLGIINTVMDAVEYSSSGDGNLLRMIKKFPSGCAGTERDEDGLAG